MSKFYVASAYALALIFGTMAPEPKAFACAPPLDALMVQVPELSLIVNSAELHAKLRATGALAIRAIHAERRPYRVIGSNGCVFDVQPRWENSDYPGMCPKLAGLTIGEARCPERRSSDQTQ